MDIQVKLFSLITKIRSGTNKKVNTTPILKPCARFLVLCTLFVFQAAITTEGKNQ